MNFQQPYSPSQKKAFHFITHDGDMIVKLNQLKRIASSERPLQPSAKKRQHSEYASRIMALNASNEQVYNDSRRSEFKQLDDAIKRELEFIRDQTETVKNELRLCDSLSSGRRSKNQSVLSYKTLESNLQSKLSQLVGAQSLTSTPRTNKSYNQEHKRVLQGKNLKSNQENFVLQPPKSKNFLFCLFSRLSNSQVITQVDRNKIRVRSEDKCGSQFNFKTYKFKNNIVTSLSEIPELFQQHAHIKTFMLIGGKSTSKRKIVFQLIKAIVQNEALIKITIDYAIHGSISQNDKNYALLPYQLIQQPVQVYSVSFRNQKELEERYGQLESQIRSDNYYKIKDYLHEQIAICQEKIQRKAYMDLLHQAMKSIRVCSVHVQTYAFKARYNIITTNYILSSSNLLKGCQSLSSVGDGEALIQQAIEEMDDKHTVRIFCINPLRYRIQDSLKMLELVLQQRS